MLTFLIIFIIWYLFGSVGVLCIIYLEDDEITVGNLLWAIPSGFLGLIVFIILLSSYLKYDDKFNEFLDKKVIVKGK